MGSKLPPWSVALLILGFTLILGITDWFSGFTLHFFVFYFMPVSFAAWYLGLTAGVATAVLCSLSWVLAGFWAGSEYPTHLHAVWNATVRLMAFLVIAFSMAKMKALVEQEKNANAQLRKAISEVKVLGALLPICAACKKIRDEKGVWHMLETYIVEHSNSNFSHGYCPDCYRKALDEAELSGGTAGSDAGMSGVER